MFRKLYVFVSRKFRSLFKDYFRKRDSEILKNNEFVIISNDCWGGSAYQWYKRPYNTPFVGLFIYGSCYMKLLNNFEYYMAQKLSFITKSKYPSNGLSYPIGLLSDIEIHFQHFTSEDEAREKWERRTERMNKVTNLDNYFFKICDKLTTKSNLLEFHELPFKNKISFSVYNYKELRAHNHIVILESHKNRWKFVPNGKKLFELTYLYFDLNKWLLG